MPDINTLVPVIDVHPSWKPAAIRRVLWENARLEGMDWPVERKVPSDEFFESLGDDLVTMAGCPINVDLSTLPVLDLYTYNKHADGITAARLLTQPMDSSYSVAGSSVVEA